MMWHLRYGSWWMVQWMWLGWISVGFHIDFKHHHMDNGESYGPYIDLHLGLAIVSIGNNPVYCSDTRVSYAIPRKQG